MINGNNSNKLAAYIVTIAMVTVVASIAHDYVDQTSPDSRGIANLIFYFGIIIVLFLALILIALIELSLMFKERNHDKQPAAEAEEIMNEN